MSYLGKERAGLLAARGNEPLIGSIDREFMMPNADESRKFDDGLMEKEKSPITFLESDIFNQIEVIHKIITAIEQKLDAVMVPQYEQTTKESSVELAQVNRSPLYHRLMSTHTYLTTVAQKLDNIHSRIQL